MPRSSSLTEREIEFCKEFIEAKGQRGWQNIIANHMDITFNTVNTHKNNVFLALLVNSLTELMHRLLTTTDWQYTEWEKKKIKALKVNPRLK